MFNFGEKYDAQWELIKDAPFDPDFLKRLAIFFGYLVYYEYEPDVLYKPGSVYDGLNPSPLFCFFYKGEKILVSLNQFGIFIGDRDCGAISWAIEHLVKTYPIIQSE